MIIKINKEIIKAINPCADRYRNFIRHYPTFDGRLEEFLVLTSITIQDKLWVALRLMPRNLVEIFAIDCAVSAADAACAAYADAAAAYADAAAAYAYAAAAAYADAAAAYAAYAAAAYAAAAACATFSNERQRQIEAIIYLIQNEE